MRAPVSPSRRALALVPCLVALVLVASVAHAQVAPKVDPGAPTVATRAEPHQVHPGETFPVIIPGPHKAPHGG